MTECPVARNSRGRMLAILWLQGNYMFKFWRGRLIAAQAELDEGREVSETLKKDQHYCYKITARKDRNGVRIHVRYCVIYVDYLRLVLSPILSHPYR